MHRKCLAWCFAGSECSVKGTEQAAATILMDSFKEEVELSGTY